MSNTKYQQEDVDPCPNMLIGAALLVPSFGGDLSTWRLTISNDGEIIQELRSGFANFIYDSVVITLRNRASDLKISQLRSMIDEVDFSSFVRRYGADHCTDLQTTVLHIPPKRVEAYGASLLAIEGNEKMKKYVHLWNQIVDLAPYRGTETKARSEEDVLKYAEVLFGDKLSKRRAKA